MVCINQIIKCLNAICINGDKGYLIKSYGIDSRQIKKDDFFIPLVGEKVDAHDYIIECVNGGICGYFIESNCINKDNIINESIKINKDVIIIEVENSKNALYEIGKLNRSLHMDIPLIAITGSVAKTSTRQIISSIFSKNYKVLTTYKNYNGDIGLPLMLLKLDDQDIAILEHGVDHAGEMKKLVNASMPNIAVVTMIGTSHIGLFKNEQNIFKEKMDIISNVPKNSFVILNDDDKFLKGYMNENVNILRYSMKEVQNIKKTDNKISFETLIYGLKYKVVLASLGLHNIQNTIASIKVAEIFNVDIEDILKGIKEFKNEPCRFELINLKNNILLIDDTYNASIDSMKSGIKSIMDIDSKRKIVVLGDMLELGEYSDSLHTKVGKLFKYSDVDILYTYGNYSKLIAGEASKYLNDVRFFKDKGKLIINLLDEIKNDDLIYFKASNFMNFKEIIEKIKEYLK